MNPTLYRTFELPNPQPEAGVFEILPRSNPSPEMNADPPEMLQGSPFHTIPSRLLTISMSFNLDLSYHSFMLFVLYSALLDDVYPGYDKVIPLDAWGPEKSRVISMKSERSWICYIHGTRFVRAMPVEPQPETADISSTLIYVYDFNP
ncbi:hypothetical protein M422DRAFT_276755 [Sphaerobolus stellatus SS14]|uniref:Uncharacterized protein n=1 Tax=Sphaerobolus stellatus (strain SS14) TaxID=990650 RepID=A0A0C9UCG0_SPHS4|nr:hypothetical protein M422DRAFT_276755 [Sphaerobolus stellatus SS14]